MGIEKFESTILGAVFFRNYDISINRDKGEISFIRSNCGNL